MATASWSVFAFGPAGFNAAVVLQLFTHFAMLSLLAVGGAITTVPDMHRFLVTEKTWLSDGQFAASVALAQAAPGPNVLFVAVLGYNAAGLAGVAATMLGTLLPSTTLAMAVVRWGRNNPQSRGLRAFTDGMAPLTIGLLVATGWVLLRPNAWQLGSLKAAPLLLAAATVLFMLKTRFSPVWMIALGALAGVLGWV